MTTQITRLYSLAVFVALLAGSAALAGEPEVIPLWPDMKVETTQGTNTLRERGTTTRPNRFLVDVRRAGLILLPAPPDKATGTAIVICPGGGYSGQAIDKEGFEIAKWLNSIGVTAVILEYRLPRPEITKGDTPLPLIDARRAIQFVRENARELDIDPKRVGIMGFSAGGHLASSLITHFQTADQRPDFAILGYPVISLKDAKAHKGSRRNLLGENPDPAMVELYSNELHVTGNTPSTFLFHAKDDKGVPVANSEAFFAAMNKAAVSAHLEVFEKGGHGFGLGEGECAKWTGLCAAWLKKQGFLPDEAIK